MPFVRQHFRGQERVTQQNLPVFLYQQCTNLEGVLPRQRLVLANRLEHRFKVRKKFLVSLVDLFEIPAFMNEVPHRTVLTSVEGAAVHDDDLVMHVET